MPVLLTRCAGSWAVALVSASGGGWREREKAREESWGPPREGGGRKEDEEGEREEREDKQESERFPERRPPRSDTQYVDYKRHYCDMEAHIPYDQEWP